MELLVQKKTQKTKKILIIIFQKPTKKLKKIAKKKNKKKLNFDDFILRRIDQIHAWFQSNRQ